MLALPDLAPACAVLVGRDSAGRFAHLGTAWCMGAGEWVSAWTGEDPPDEAILISVQDGRTAVVQGWELADGLAGFTADVSAPILPTRRDAPLTKRDRLHALGFPDIIDHPALALARGSLDVGRYFPYLCPWVIQGHLALFSGQEGWLTGRCYPGMEGGPVIDEHGLVVGVLAHSPVSPDHPPLARFHRLA